MKTTISGKGLSPRPKSYVATDYRGGKLGHCHHFQIHGSSCLCVYEMAEPCLKNAVI